MLAAPLSDFGDPAVLSVQQVDDPAVPRGWVSVELRAAALNWHDCLLRQGAYPFELPVIPGADGAGVRRDTNEEVVILPSLRWGADERAPGPDWEILGDRTNGTYAELIAVPQENIFPKPADWSWTEAAALPLAGLTAFRALFTRGALRPDETALILGAGGGVASIAVGLASQSGARVLVTTSTAEKLSLARSLGASGGVLYTSEEWPAQVRELTGGEGVDLVIDSVGSSWPAALDCLRDGGRLVSFGATGASVVEVDVRRFYFGQKTILGTTMGSPRDFAGLMAMLKTMPQWRPTIDRAFPLEEIAAAHTLMERRAHTGKIVITMA